MQVDNILQSKGKTVHTVTPMERVADAVDLLNTHRIGAVVVVNDAGGVAGILSERDIVRKMGLDPTAFLQRPVADCMTSPVVTCAPGDTVAEVMEIMTRHRIRHLPVCENNALVGIVTIGDVVKGKIEETEQEAMALREYIAS